MSGYCAGGEAVAVGGCGGNNYKGEGRGSVAGNLAADGGGVDGPASRKRS